MKKYQRLQDLREDRDLKQEDVAKVLGITRQQYQLYESGKREIRFFQIIELAKFYNVPIDYIAELTNEPVPYKRSNEARKKHIG
ncbi:MAG: helix-turn-helix transcriptional regulator [Oscillospiraceae bacterium]|nr:helix-turn-helix transcriptional regulator [Oscillospiraceae bacterium]MBQ4164958.1 helix-turn-helix transcriptional regulator [Oscillospiraceae bacterium]